MAFNDRKLISYTVKVNGSAVDKTSPILPTLNPTQEQELDGVKDPLERAERMIKMLGLDKHALAADPDAQQLAENLAREEKIYDLYWNIVDHCEKLYSPLFNRLNSYHLMEFLHSEHRPIF